MTKHYKILFSLGFIVFILPFLGIPYTLKIVIQFIVGIILIIISLLYRFWHKGNKKDCEEAVFEENNGEIAKPSPYTEEEPIEEEIEETSIPEETTDDEK